jgi:hypothetical protein
VPQKLSFTSSSIIGQLLSVHMLTMLIQKGLITEEEVRALGDDALLSLETWRAVFPANHDDFDEARQFFENYARFPRTNDA